jgi:hypothetical protein
MHPEYGLISNLGWSTNLREGQNSVAPPPAEEEEDEEEGEGHVQRDDQGEEPVCGERRGWASYLLYITPGFSVCYAIDFMCIDSPDLYSACIWPYLSWSCWA